MAAVSEEAAIEGNSLSELLCALSYVADIGMGQRLEHGLRSAYIGLNLCEDAGLSFEDREAVFYGALLKDAGCTACATVFATFFWGDDLAAREDCLLLQPDSVSDAIGWFWRHSPADVFLPSRMARFFAFLAECRGVMKEGVTAHCEVGQMFSTRLGLPSHIGNTVRYAWERWDGKGLGFGLKGANIPPPARILHLSQVVEAAFSFGTETAALAIASERSGKDFDPELAGRIRDLGARPDFWQPLKAESIQPLLMKLRPASRFDKLSEAQVEDVCLVLADFADAKCRLTWNHSPKVAEVALKAANALGLGGTEARDIRRAGLVHDLGKAAVPVGILEKGGALTASETERFNAHPRYTETVLNKVDALRHLTSTAAAHHEQIDGQGYHLGLRGDDLRMPARVLAAADRCVSLQAGERDPERVVKTMQSLAGSALDPDCVRSLADVIGEPASPRRPADARAASLSDREVEVIRLIAEGATNREVADRLVISPKTVEHHLESIYNKLGVSSKTAAAVYAVVNGLAAPEL
jgi:HD-GYP domain-containing protein (c-di-GMP phosphodiesterase class II)